MNLTELKNALLKTFPHDPTHGQLMLMDKLAGFIISPAQQTMFLLCGYAGTGKTSLVISLVRVLPSLGGDMVLLAPTGRAAKVLTGYTGQRAHTIHRYIYLYQTTGEGITRIVRQKNKSRNTLFVVDEASMIQGEIQTEDISLFSSRNLLGDLLDFIAEGDNCKLLLIGDSAQLPPVGKTISPAMDAQFLDKIYGWKVIRHELTEVVRQEENSGILINATYLRNQISRNKVKTPFFSIADYHDVRRISGMELEEELNNTISGGNRGDICIICRSNKRANLFNREIRSRILGKDSEIAAGDFLMIVKNNYFWLKEDSVAGFIANGDIAEILHIKRYDELYGYRFADVTLRLTDYPDEKPVDVKIMLDTIMMNGPCLPYEENKMFFNTVSEDYNDIPSKRGRNARVMTNPFYNALQVKFAYSFTCHKTQGGQWDTVFIDQGYLTKESINPEYLRWLYTAVTRAVSKVYFVNFNDEFFSGN